MSSIGARDEKPHKISQNVIRIIIMPSALFMLMLAVTIYGWILVLKDQNHKALLDTISATEQTAARVENFVSTRLALGNHLRQIWNTKQIEAREAFDQQARSIHSLFPDIQAINWVSPDRVIRWVSPLEGNEKAIGLDLKKLPVPNALLSKVISTGELQTSPLLELAQGGVGFVAYIPLFDGVNFKGFINMVFKVAPLLTADLVEDTSKRFVFRIKDGESIVVETGQFSDEYTQLQVNREIIVGNRKWLITGQLDPEEIIARNSILDEFVLIGGFMIATTISLLLAGILHHQHKLNLSEEKFRRVFEQASAGMTIVDLKGRFEQVNQAFLKMLGYTKEELKGKFFNDLTHPEDRDIGVEAMRALLADSDSAQWFEKRYLHKDGQVVFCEVSAAALRDSEGRPYLFTSQVQDFTKRKENEIALIEAIEKAEFANRAKSEFLASMSHDLRTPLNAILGFSEVMAREIFGPLGSERYIEYAELIHKSGGRLVSMVNDILDLSKIESNEYTLNETFVDVIAELKAAKDRCALKPSDRIAGRINVIGSEGLPRLYCDERAFSQILDNLITNSLKYSKETDNINLMFTLDENGEGIITIADTGMGIAKENLKGVILPFVQAFQSSPTNSYVSKKQDGIGLGLHIVSRLVNLHEAKFDIQSELGVGTKVYLRFPVERMEKI